MTKLILAALVMGLTSFASASTASAPLNSQGSNANPNPFPGLTYYGGSIFRVESSTPTDTAVLLISGSGHLFGISHSSGTTGDQCIVMDSATASGITLGTQGKALSPAVLTSANGSTTCTAQQVCGQWSAQGGDTRFTNGLVAIKHGSSNSNCLISAVSDTVIASGSH